MSRLTSRQMGSQVFLYLSCPQVVSFAHYNFIYRRITGNYTNKKEARQYNLGCECNQSGFCGETIGVIGVQGGWVE